MFTMWCRSRMLCLQRKGYEKKIDFVNLLGLGKDKALPQVSAWCLIEMQHAACGWGHVTCCVRCDETKCWLWRVTWPRDSAGIFTHDNILLRYNCYLAPACLVMTVMNVMNVMSRVTPNICFPCSPFHLRRPHISDLTFMIPSIVNSERQIQRFSQVHAKPEAKTDRL